MILRAQINKAMPLPAAAVAAFGVDFQIFSPDSPPPPSCKHIWDAMVGLVSAFGGKFGFLIFFVSSKKKHSSNISFENYVNDPLVR